MKSIQLYLISGILFGLTLASGFILSHLGKPYRGLWFNVHKLLALGAVVFMVIRVLKLLKSMDAGSLAIVMLVLAAISIIALFASGTLISLGKMDDVLMLWIHRIATGIVIVAILSLMRSGGKIAG